MITRLPRPASTPGFLPSTTRALSTTARRGKASAHLFDVGGATTYPPAAHSSAASASSAQHSQRDRDGRPLRVVMFGKPGAGKGTLSARLTNKYDVSFISSGDSLRRHIAERSDVGRVAEELVAQGKFLPDEVMLRVVKAELEELRKANWILDGFPRTLPQARMLDDYLARRATPLTLIVHLDVPDSIILSRIKERWTHLPSGRIYNLSYNPPKAAGVDDLTGEPLSKRPDDTPEVFARRLETFVRETAPLLSYYAAPDSPARVVSLKGNTSDEIWPLLERELGSYDVRLKKDTPPGPLRVEDEVIRLAEKDDSLKDEARPWAREG